MKPIHFIKAEGAQNDFVIVDDMAGELSVDIRTAFSKHVCHRRKSIGADGTIFISPSDTHDFEMAFYNPDGSFGSMCGNGGRCAALFAEQQHITPAVMRFETLGRTYRARVQGNRITLFFPQPQELGLNLPLTVRKSTISAHFAHTGAPHVVVFLDEQKHPLPALKDLDVHTLGKEIRNLPQFQPEGTNVNFVSVSEYGLLAIRTFEKGVESETEACGTGNLAAGIIACAVKAISPPVRLVTHGGDLLTIGFDEPAKGTEICPEYFSQNLYLEGPAHLVFEGTIDLDTILKAAEEGTA